MARKLFVVVLLILLAASSPSGFCLSKSVVGRLRASAQQHYKGGALAYSVMIYRGKAFAATRGMLEGHLVVGVWEYVPNDWHLIFDYPKPPPDPKEVNKKFSSYGFTPKMQKKLLGSWKKF